MPNRRKGTSKQSERLEEMDSFQGSTPRKGWAASLQRAADLSLAQQPRSQGGMRYSGSSNGSLFRARGAAGRPGSPRTAQTVGVSANRAPKRGAAALEAGFLCAWGQQQQSPRVVQSPGLRCSTEQKSPGARQSSGELPPRVLARRSAESNSTAESHLRREQK